MKPSLVISSLLALALLGSPTASTRPDAPDSTFKKASGRMYCEANHGASACKSIGRLTVSLDPGYTIDRSYHQGTIPCCGGDENRNGNITEIPPGVYMEFVGGRDGEWGVFGIRLVADSTSVNDDGQVTAWTITSDQVYCGPSAAVGKGGCNVNAYAWIKQKRVALLTSSAQFS